VTRGAFLHAEKDPFVGAAIGTKSLAETMGAKTLSLGDVGHWWMLEDPEGSAQVLESWINRR
jgi:pimeloyl-ACP methyl ester carboxylesterase